MTPQRCPHRPSRRSVLGGLAAGLLSGTMLSGRDALAHTETGSPRQRGTAPRFDPAYIRGAVEPFGRMAIYTGDRLTLPMIDLAFSKQAAIPPHLWGMLYDGWQENMQAEGLSVFLQGYEQRGPENARKRIYMTATTPDLYRAHYAAKVARFLDSLFDSGNAGKPLMRTYYDGYFDLYWDLHLGVRGDNIPQEVRDLGAGFNAVIGFWDPRLPEVYENYMRVRALRATLRDWIDARVQDVLDRRVDTPEATFVHYWLVNGEQGENFRREDIVFECFHNFLAFSQWGNTLYNVMALLERDQGDRAVQDWFRRTMEGDPDEAGDSPFTRLDRMVMELFRTILPNTGSLSTIAGRGAAPETSFILHPHPEPSQDPRHWPDPGTFNPDRYLGALTTAQVTQEACQASIFARCPFSTAARPLRDGRQGRITNSGFGTVYAEVEGHAWPKVDHAGYAPFGFGSRRCAGELLTIYLFKDVLRHIWRENIRFERTGDANAERLPVGPGTVISDDIRFARAA